MNFIKLRKRETASKKMLFFEIEETNFHCRCCCKYNDKTHTKKCFLLSVLQSFKTLLWNWNIHGVICGKDSVCVSVRCVRDFVPTSLHVRIFYWCSIIVRVHQIREREREGERQTDRQTRTKTWTNIWSTDPVVSQFHFHAAHMYIFVNGPISS